MSKHTTPKPPRKPARMLPSGFRTRSLRRYCREWKALGKTIADATDSTMMNCDPGLSFMRRYGLRDTWELPVDVALSLAQALERKARP
jgi:hypothetical protein